MGEVYVIPLLYKSEANYAYTKKTLDSFDGKHDRARPLTEFPKRVLTNMLFENDAKQTLLSFSV